MYFKSSSGFALPTIMIASIVMIMVLLSAVQVTVVTRSSLDSQYYDNLARSAAESGVVMAEACLKRNNYIPQWGAAGSSLRPNSTCAGTTTDCITADCYIVAADNIRTRFIVNEPIAQVGNQLVTSTGIVELLRSSDGSVWRTYTYDARARVGAEATFNNLVYGYNYDNIAQDSAFFFTLASDGKISAVGGNSYGQLGIGSTTPTTTPKPVNLPVGSSTVTSVHTSILSRGHNSIFILNGGYAYAAGKNDTGALGLGLPIISPQSTPRQLFYYESGTNHVFGAVGNQKAKHAFTLGYSTFILTEDGYLYSAGDCIGNLLGRGCGDKDRFVRISVLDPASAATRPTSKLALDSYTVYVITEGGRLYTWGWNSDGQMALGDRTTRLVPTKIGEYGDAGKPTAAQVVSDGVSVYVAGSDGKVHGSGRNEFGQVGNKYISLYNGTAGDTLCMDGNSSSMYLNACGNQRYEFRTADNTIIRTTDNGATVQCMDDGPDDTTSRFVTCNGLIDQKFTYRPDQYYSITSLKTGNCLDNKDGGLLAMNPIRLWGCSSNPNMTWKIADVLSFTQFELPASAGTATKVATDQWSTLVLGSNGEVWGAGLNASGQLGNGSTSKVQIAPVKFILPGTVKAVDVFNTGAGMGTVASLNYRYANTFVIGDDGKVYGAGDNEEGQLGNGLPTADYVATPVVMNEINGSNIRAKQVQSGFGTTVVLTENGVVYTVGNNSNGQLGDGTTTDSSTPRANTYTNVMPRTLF